MQALKGKCVYSALLTVGCLHENTNDVQKISHEFMQLKVLYSLLDISIVTCFRNFSQMIMRKLYPVAPLIADTINDTDTHSICYGQHHFGNYEQNKAHPPLDKLHPL